MRKTMLNKICLLMIVGAAFGLVGMPALGQTWNYTSDWSFVSNPAGDWSYGRLDSSYGSFELDLTQLVDGTLQIWCDPPTMNPAPACNVGDAIDYAAIGTYFPGYMGFLISQPNADSHRTDARWTAPVDGVVNISAVFQGLDYSVGSYSDASVMSNGSTLFSGQVRGYYGGGGHDAFGASPTATYSGTISVVAGQTIDFILSNPGDRAGYDRVGFDATITLVPEPSALLALSGGVGFLNMFTRRRRR